MPMNKKVKFFLLGIVIFIFFLLFSYLVNKDLFTSFDLNTTVRLQDKLIRIVDGPFSFFSLLGDFEVISFFLVIALFLLRKINGVFILPVYFLLNLVELYAKYFIDHLPPPHFLLRTEQIVDFPKFYVSTQNSYPSGHMARTVFLTVILVFLLQRSKKLSKNTKYLCFGFLILFDIVMFVSRIYLGEHWSTDVIGGAFLGFAFAIGSLIFI